ncbi:hypothetical protein F5Y12DRAFT_66948 [Xylaria sp. FL1777]|nr:hypothetical protein F5Y12DRAFT_66948 [Xylaria sp. FL1777]
MTLPFSSPSRLAPGFTMSRCTPADVQDMDAFSNSEYTYWWGSIPVMKSWQEERIRRRFVDASTQQFKVVDDANGTIVAWAKWDPPPCMTGLREGFVVYDETGRPMSTSSLDADDGGKTKPLKEKEQANGNTSGKSYALGPPEDSNIALFHEFYDALMSMEKKYQASQKLVLTHLCARHSYHNRGIGTALLRSVLDLADREGVPAYLEASRVGAPVYQRLGFKTVEVLEFDRTETGSNTPATLYVMVREPGAA